MVTILLCGVSGALISQLSLQIDKYWKSVKWGAEWVNIIGQTFIQTVWGMRCDIRLLGWQWGGRETLEMWPKCGRGGGYATLGQSLCLNFSCVNILCGKLFWTSVKNAHKKSSTTIFLLLYRKCRRTKDVFNFVRPTLLSMTWVLSASNASNVCRRRASVSSPSPSLGISHARIDLSTFTHTYNRVVGVDSEGSDKDSTHCVICLGGKN